MGINLDISICLHSIIVNHDVGGELDSPLKILLYIMSQGAICTALEEYTSINFRNS